MSCPLFVHLLQISVRRDSRGFCLIAEPLHLFFRSTRHLACLRLSAKLFTLCFPIQRMNDQHHVTIWHTVLIWYERADAYDLKAMEESQRFKGLICAIWRKMQSRTCHAERQSYDTHHTNSKVSLEEHHISRLHQADLRKERPRIQWHQQNV